MERRCCRVCSFDNALIRQFLQDIRDTQQLFRYLSKLKQMQTGTVKFFNESKGFGFISQKMVEGYLCPHFRISRLSSSRR